MSGNSLIVNGSLASNTFPNALAKYDDAFARLRISNPVTLFSIDFQNGELLNNVFGVLTTGGATRTYIPDESAYNLTAPAGGRVFAQSKPYVSYQPGKSLLVLLSGNLGLVNVDNCVSRIGSFDDAGDKTPTPTPELDRGGDGHFFQLESVGGVPVVSVVQRSSTDSNPFQSDEVVAQANWNRDKLDGTGVSGETLDPNKANVFIIDREWLGVGRVRMGFFIKGQPVYCHQFENSNVIESTYMKRASLPVRYEVDNTLGASPASMRQICSTVSSEGGFTGRGRIQYKGLPVAGKAITVANVVTPIISIRLKLDYRRVPVILQSISAVNGSSNTARFSLVLNGTLTAPSFASVNATSAVEFDTAATAISGGVEIYTDTVVGTNQINPQLTSTFSLTNSNALLSCNYDSTLDVMTLCVEMNSVGGGVTVHGDLGWAELF